MKKIIYLLVAILSFSGCISPFIGPVVSVGVQAYVMWKNGEATAYYATDADTTYQSVKRVLEELDHTISIDEKDSKGSYKIVSGDKDKFKISIVKVEPYITQLKIRINFMGDKPYAEIIFQKLEKHLDIIDFTTLKNRKSRRT